ncbi:transmembrane 9 superfamily member 1 [Trichomonascus vanleenenianus]|uniref:Tmn2p n=1 Tax=Trichomonascus vanleenenianus TaxID=2268995 RepID=UPI003ECAAFE1
MRVLFYLLVSVLGVCQAFYLPGVAPTDYDQDERVPLLVNSLTPGNDYGTSGSVISYDYYFRAFNFCAPKGGPKKQSESLGSILFGDRIFDSPFELLMRKNETCKKLCTAKYTPRDAKFVSRRIMQGYNHNWIVDGLPAAQEMEDPDTNSTFYAPGFPLGSAETSESSAALNNHYDITIEYHETRGKKLRVVGVIVRPSSRQTTEKDGNVDCSETEDMVILNDAKETTVMYTYSVTWVPSPTSWGTRWDKYLHVYDPKIHWFSLVNSVIVVVFLVGLVATVLTRALHRDIARYNEIDLSEDAVQEDSGWKLVHGDVFRAPKYRMALSILLGSGIQLFVMAAVTLFFALLGFLSPSNRGSLSTMMILFYTVFGFAGGYVSARAYKTLGGEQWKLNMILTPLVVPGVVFAIFVALNFFLVFAGSSGAVPFGTMLALTAIWFAFSVPLSCGGYIFGASRKPISFPVRTNQIPRQIPPQPRYLQRVPAMFLAGLFPFFAISVELYFIMNSIWSHRLYYMFGFLFVCYGLMITTSSAVTVLMTYFSLTSENYHWQWRAFLFGGSCAIYIWLNALLYLLSKLSLGGFISNVLYLGYSLIFSILVFVLTGSIGLLTAFFFVRRIYSSIKID